MSSKKHRKPQPATTTAIVELPSPALPPDAGLTLEQPVVDTAIPVEAGQSDAPIVQEEQTTGLAVGNNAVETPAEVQTPTLPAGDTLVATLSAVPPLPTEEVPVETREPEVPSATPDRATPAKKLKADKGGLSAINAAARVLARKGKPMSCQELIGVMAQQGLWTSPGGKTPSATLYAAILREIQVEGAASRFVKVGRGLFAINPKITEGATAKATRAKKPKGEQLQPEANAPPIADGTEGPKSLKELFRV